MASAKSQQQAFQEKTNTMVQKWINKYYPMEHHTVAYVGIFGVWDIMGHNEIDSQVLVKGPTDHLKILKSQLCNAIDKEISRRENAMRNNGNNA